MNLKKLALLALIGLLAGLYIHFDLGQYLSLQSLKNQQAAIEAFRASNPLLSVAGYFVVYVIVTALSFPGAALLTLAGGAIFGLLWGTVMPPKMSGLPVTRAWVSQPSPMRNAGSAGPVGWVIVSSAVVRPAQNLRGR